MKQIGTTPSGGAIIELDIAETAILCDALRALDGESRFSFTRPVLPEDRNIAPLFALLLEWATVRFSINQIRSAVDQLQAATERRQP